MSKSKHIPLHRKKGIPFGEFVELNREYLYNLDSFHIDLEHFCKGVGTGNMYLAAMYEDLDDVIRRFRSEEFFDESQCRLVAEIHLHRMKDGYTHLQINTLFQEDYEYELAHGRI